MHGQHHLHDHVLFLLHPDLADWIKFSALWRKKLLERKILGDWLFKVVSSWSKEPHAARYPRRLGGLEGSRHDVTWRLIPRWFLRELQENYSRISLIVFENPNSCNWKSGAQRFQQFQLLFHPCPRAVMCDLFLFLAAREPIGSLLKIFMHIFMHVKYLTLYIYEKNIYILLFLQALYSSWVPTFCKVSVVC